MNDVSIFTLHFGKSKLSKHKILTNTNKTTMVLSQEFLAVLQKMFQEETDTGCKGATHTLFILLTNGYGQGYRRMTSKKQDRCIPPKSQTTLKKKCWLISPSRLLYFHSSVTIHHLLSFIIANLAANARQFGLQIQHVRVPSLVKV